MADDERPGSPRRAPSAYQAIEPLDEGAGRIDGPKPAFTPAPAPPAPPPAPEPIPTVPLGVRFASAAAALAFAGQLLSIGRGDSLTFWSDAEYARWVRAEAELDITRELAAAAHGTVFVEVAPGRLAEDHGWGSAPAAGTAGASGVAADSLAPLRLAELIRIAGLYQVAEPAPATVHILLPGAELAAIVRRALDLRLDTAHRPVRLRPLFAQQEAADTGTALTGTALLELRLSAREGTLPPSLLSALARDERLTVCRVGGENGNLLVQYGAAAPLHDDLLAGLIGSQTWVLATGRLGCQLLEPAADFTDSMSSVRLADGYPLQSATPPSDDRPTAPELRVIRMRTYGRGVDAVLLTDTDLDAVTLVLEGHPLSESAQLIRGRDRHLLVVPGGALEQLPVGEPLYCLGPGALYLPLGYGMRPRLPPSARRALFTPDDLTAVVVLPAVMLRFGVTTREPVWKLWAGPLPELDLQLPAEASEALAAAVLPAPESGPVMPVQPDARDETIRTWLDEALEAEFRGDLSAAAELHERHGDPVRAARLWTRAADVT
jgi:hypothetical protein